MEKAVEIIKKKHDKPFFLSLQFNAPHRPLQVRGDNPYADTLNWRIGGTKEKFAAMVIAMDEAVGKIMQALDEEKLAANTLVIFTSYNGGEKFSDMGIYSGKKAELLEGGIRVPAFVTWPGVIAAGSITEQVAITMDWTATILAVAQAKPAAAFPLDGINLLPVCTGKKKMVDRIFYWRLFQDKKQKAMRLGNWKYFTNEKVNFFLI